tara:strand:- start:111 stop:284 length:174 start_codon:yes stop_codon:yes gene_type:complete
MDKEFLKRYVETFFKTLKKDDPKLYLKTMKMFKAGKGHAIRDIIWQVFRDSIKTVKE